MWPLCLPQIHSIVVRNLDATEGGETDEAGRGDVVDCFCELRSADGGQGVRDGTGAGNAGKTLHHRSNTCRETLNPRWILPQQESARLAMARVQRFDLHVYKKSRGLKLGGPFSSVAVSSSSVCRAFSHFPVSPSPPLA